MATHPDRPAIDYEEQRVRILRAIEGVEKFSAETRLIVSQTRKVEGEVESMPRSMIFRAMLATAALLGAGAAIAKLSFP